MKGIWNVTVACLFSLLLVTSLAAPALAGGGFSAATAGATQAAGGNIHSGSDPVGNAVTPLGSSHQLGSIQSSDGTNETAERAILSEHLLPAERLWLTEAFLRDLESSTNRSDADYASAANALNASLEHYPAAHRVDDRAAFDRQAEAVHQLARETGEEDDDALDETSLAILTAANDSARLAVERANRSLTLFGTDVDEWTAADTDRAIADAYAALDRAETSLENAPSDSLGQELHARADTIDHYREATHHAKRALTYLDDATEPEFEVFANQPVAVNETILVSVTGTVRGPQVDAFDTLEASIEGEPVANGSLRDSRGLGTDVSGTVLLELDADDGENVTVDLRAIASGGAQTLNDSVTIDLDDEAVRTIRDANTSYTERTADPASGVVVNATGDGLSPGDVTVTDETPATNQSFRAGPMVRIENRTAIDGAEVTIPLAEGVDPADGNLSIYTWEPGSGEAWHPVETELDVENGTATADVEHFSFFSVFWIGEWEAATNQRMVLEDRHLVGNESGGDSGDPAGQIDVVFVVDESGSMSGEPIHYAREAAKRFVAALNEDERGGLVGYTDSAFLDHSLTADHDALNASIEQLRAGGGTNTEAGLREGMAELERNGWENRSSVIILLSDGKSNSDSYPRDAAEDAAELGIEISTVGLGSGIDENELTDIASTTGGDFYHVANAEDLPDTFERVAENQTQVRLQDTSGDGIPDAVAEMDLRMPTGGPGVVGEPLNLDPVAIDTSGDGILDNETVDIQYRVLEEGNESYVEASVTNAAHHPARIDTTGDGLTDAEQIEGWEISYTESVSATDEFMKAISPEDGSEIDLEELDTYFENRTVHAEPLVDDTNGDGLADVDERLLGTDPEQRDTTDDGVDDVQAARFDADPTLFDNRAPEIDVYLSNWRKPRFSLRTSYVLGFAVEDPAGLGEAEVVQEDEVRSSHDLAGQLQTVHSEFETGRFDTVTDIYSGTKVRVEATDRHGNLGQEPAVERYDIFGEISKQLASEGVGGTRLENELGALSGFSSGAVETAEFFEALLTDPLGFLAAIKDIIGAITNLDEIIAALPENVREQQRDQNPHDPEDPEQVDHYEAYRDGWYEGYVSYMVVEMVLPAGEAKRVLQSSKRLQTAVDTIDQTGDLRRAARYAGQAKHTAYAPVRYSGYQLSRGVAASIDVSREVGGRLLSGVRSSSQQVKVSTRLERADIDSQQYERLSRAEQEEVGTYLARGGDETALKRALDSSCPIAPFAYGVSIQMQNCGIDLPLDSLVWRIDDATIRNDLVRAIDRGDIDQATGETLAREFSRADPTIQTTPRAIRESDQGTVVEATTRGKDGEDITVNAHYFADGEEYVRNILRGDEERVREIFRRNNAEDVFDEHGLDAIKHLDEAPDGYPARIRGELGEEILQPHHMTRQEKYGEGGFNYDPEMGGAFERGYLPEEEIPFDMSGDQHGFDGLAITENNELVIMDSKVKNVNPENPKKSNRVTRGEWTEKTSGGARQLSENWNEQKFQELADSADTSEQKAFLRELADNDGINAINIREVGDEIEILSINPDNMNTELLAYRNGPDSGELASGGLRSTQVSNPSIDTVEVINIGSTFEGV